MQKSHLKGPVDTSGSPHAHWHALPLDDITFEEDSFWAKKQATNRHSLEHGYAMLEQAGNLHNLRVAAGLEVGDYRGRNFLDSDTYKWLEAAVYELRRNPDNSLRQKVDDTIALIAGAQQPDGYINTYYQLVEPNRRWSDLDHGHELYCAGHLFQAAVAHHRVTGQGTLLDVAVRFADYIDFVFGPGKRSGAPGHPEIEMALVELFRETGQRRYLELAQFLVDERGQKRMRGLGWLGPEYHQDDVPIREAEAIKGHAVRALYLMAGVTDLYLETGEQALLDAMYRLWHDMTSRKLHITGGAGAQYEGESFGVPYELPNNQCYCETCAAIASIMWNWRMLQATGDARFADLMEHTLFNGFLSGPALDGTSFFYINPLLSQGGYERDAWYKVACCPPNIMRTIGAIEHYVATTNEGGVQIHLYDMTRIHRRLRPDQEITLQIETQYPWQGQVQLTVTESDKSPWTLALRVPGWCKKATVHINGIPHDRYAQPGSYIELERSWQPGDVVALDFAAIPRLLVGHPQIDATRGSVAIQYGPVLYCLEQVDQAADVDITAIQINENEPMDAIWQPNLLDGIVVVRAHGFALDTSDWQNQLYKPLEEGSSKSHKTVQLEAIPYYRWGNRGPGPMRVWIPKSNCSKTG